MTGQLETESLALRGEVIAEKTASPRAFLHNVCLQQDTEKII